VTAESSRPGEEKQEGAVTQRQVARIEGRSLVNQSLTLLYGRNVGKKNLMFLSSNPGEAQPHTQE
jgi:hypothetical protein